MTSAFQLATNVMEIGIAVMGQMNTIAQSIVSGMNGVTGVAVLPHVEEDHNLLQGQYYSRLLMGERSVVDSLGKVKAVEHQNAQLVSITLLLYV